jgi:hypothetical protein
MQLPELFDFEH